MISFLQTNFRRVYLGLGRAIKSLSSTFFLLVGIFTSISTFAQVDIRLSGFATLGISAENQDDLGFIRDSNQSKDPSRDTGLEADSIIGGQISSAFYQDWRATLQLVYRDRPKQSFSEATELAFLGYRPLHSIDIRLGRVAVDMFRLSDYRRVDYINLWVRPPTEVYAWILPSSIDGADAAFDWNHGSQFWRFKVQYGNTSPLIEFPDGSQKVETKFNDFIVSTLTLDYDVWHARLSYSTAKTAASTPGFVDGLAQVGALLTGPVADEASFLAQSFRDVANQPVRYVQASLSYDDSLWLFDAEIADIDAEEGLVPMGTAAYLSLGRRIKDWTPYIVRSQFDSSQDLYMSTADWSSTGFAGLRDAAVATINGVQIEQSTYSLGVRWDLAEKFAAKAQWDRTEIKQGKFAIWAHTNGVSASDKDVNVFSLSLNYLF